MENKIIIYCKFYRECEEGKTCYKAYHDAIIQERAKENARLEIEIMAYSEKPPCFKEFWDH